MVRAARGEKVERPPAWMMRQAGRYQKAYRDLAKKHPGFRERSETTDLIVEISLQPWESFRPDGVILFSDILTPLEACGVPFEIDDNAGPLIEAPIVEMAGLKALHPIDLDKLTFVGDALAAIRKEVDPAGAAVLGFVGSPWTLATYVVEGKSTSLYKTIKVMMFQQSKLLDGILSHLATQIAEYSCYQIEAGAQYVQARFRIPFACVLPDACVFSVSCVRDGQVCMARTFAQAVHVDCGHRADPPQLESMITATKELARVQLFDSWGGQLPPHLWDKWSRPYIEQIIATVKQRHPDTPLMLYANGSGGLLERMGATGADVIGLDWTIDMADARRRLGPRQAVQVHTLAACLSCAVFE
jgi:uroporphyrinogen-III decarboxylase